MSCNPIVIIDATEPDPTSVQEYLPLSVHEPETKEISDAINVPEPEPTEQHHNTPTEREPPPQ